MLIWPERWNGKWFTRAITRAPGTSLPTLDGLASRSFAASRALSAEAGKPIYDMTTALAIPSLLYGKRALYSAAEGPGATRIRFAGRYATVLGAGNSIFARVRSQGWNSAVAGWYLPYCRVFASRLTDCYWDERYDQASSASSAPFEAAVDETRMLFETDMFSPFGRSLADARHFAEYEALLAGKHTDYVARSRHSPSPAWPRRFQAQSGAALRSRLPASRWAMEWLRCQITALFSADAGRCTSSGARYRWHLTCPHFDRWPTTLLRCSGRVGWISRRWFHCCSH